MARAVHIARTLLCTGLAASLGSLQALGAQAEPPSAEPASAARAHALRESSVVAHEAADYRRAIEQLIAADAMYRVLDAASHVADRAAVARDIVRNALAANDVEQAFVWLDELAGAAARDPVCAPSLGDAHYELYRAAAAMTPLARSLEVIERARTLYRGHRNPRLAAQCLHDRGTLIANGGGDYADVDAALQAAIRERRKLAEPSDLCWSFNNLAHFSLQADRIDEAIEPLRLGFDFVFRGEALQCQRALSINYADLIARLVASPELAGRGVGDMLWALAQSACGTDRPLITPADRHLRDALAFDVRSNGARGAVRAAKRAFDLARGKVGVSWPVEVDADLRLRAAAAALVAGKAGVTSAVGWLDALDPGQGPCAPHLRARQDALRAVVAAIRGDAEGYAEHGRRAVQSMRELGDRAMTLAVLEQLAAAEFPKGDTDVAARAAFSEELATERRNGGPGGDGASARAERIGTMPADADEHTPVFEVRWDVDAANGVSVDLLGGASSEHPLRWKPRNSSLNGFGIGVHGGYFVVRSMQYGGDVGSGGARGQSTLDELGDYLPFSPAGDWLVTSNGAVRYRPRQ